jgi:hypothetical protein
MNKFQVPILLVNNVTMNNISSEWCRDEQCFLDLLVTLIS